MPSRRSKKPAPKQTRTSIWPPAGISRTIILASLVLASTVGVSVAFPAFAAQTELKSALGNFCVSTDYSNGAHNGDPVNLARCSGVNGQAWSWDGMTNQITFHDPTGGTGCAQPAGGRFVEQTPMVMATCSSIATQPWSKQSWGGIEAAIRSTTTGHTLCLAVPNGVTSGTPQLQIRDCNNTSDDQKWSNQTAPPPPPSSSSVGQQIRDVALSQVGVAENPNGCNCGGMIDVYTQNHAEFWCNDFAQWVYYKSGHGMGSTTSYVRIGPCNSIRDWFNGGGTRGNWYPNTSFNRANHPPKAGDFIDINGGDHCAIVNFYSGGVVYSIDGNYGNRVAKVQRGINDGSIMGWGRLKTAE